MERGTKRKAAALAAPSTPTAASERPAKRIRTPHAKEPKAQQSSADVQSQARDFIEHLKRATDKNGRPISTVFVELPDPDELPDYYELIYLPISVETLQAKVDRNEYISLSELESDVKRMVANAKKYNESKSEVYEDAERIRKLTFNYMTKANPAYKGGNYAAVATPEPATPQGYPGGARTAATKTKPPAKISLKSSSLDNAQPREPSRSQSLAVATPAAVASDGEFAGKTFQQAQDMILREAMEHTIDELEIFTPFANLPSRSLTEYYATIKQPTSLKGTLKKVHGFRGRQETTGVTEFKTWDAFEAEVSKIWTNARIFNEDGSDMFNLADTFEQWFHQRLAEAKAHVPEPNAPTLKLNLNKSNATNIKLRLGQKDSATPSAAKDTPSARPQTNGTSPDQKASEPPKALTATNTDSGRTRRTSSSISRGAAANTTTPVPASSNSKPMTNGVTMNGTSNAVKSPSATNTAATNDTMTPAAPTQSAQAPQPQTLPPLPQAIVQAPPGFDSKWRTESNGTEDALLLLLRVYSNQASNTLTLPNGLPMPAGPRPAKPLKISIPPHPQLTQQSVTLSLPQSQQHLILHPKLHPSLLGGRPYRLFVTVNGMRVSQSSNPEHKLQYEARCAPGVNRIEVEVVANQVQHKKPAQIDASGQEDGDGSTADATHTPAGDDTPASAPTTNGVSMHASPAAGKDQLEVERINLFVHVLRG